MATVDARSWAALPAARLLRIAGRHRLWLYAAIVCDLLHAAANIVPHYALVRFLDAVSAGNSRDFWHYLPVFLGLSALSMPLSFFRSRALGAFGERTLAALRGQVAARALALPVVYLESRHSGDLLSLLNADLTTIRGLMASDLLQAVGQSVRAIGGLAYLLLISRQLTLVTTVLTPVVFPLLSKMAGPVSKQSNEMQEELGAAHTIAEDGLASPLVARSFNLAGIMSERFRRANASVLGKGLRIARLRAVVDGVTGAVQIAPSPDPL